MYKDAPEIALNIDLKLPKIPLPRLAYDMDSLAQKVVDMIEEFDVADRVVIESASPTILRKIIKAGGGKDKKFLVFQDFTIPLPINKWRWASPLVDGIAMAQFTVN